MGRGGGAVRLELGLAAHKHALAQLCQQGLHLRAQGLHRVHIAALVAAHGPEGGRRIAVRAHSRGVPPPSAHILQKGAEKGGVLLQRRGIARQRLLGLHNAARLGRKGQRRLAQGPGVLQKQPAPRRFAQRRTVFIHGKKLPAHCAGVRQSAQEIVQRKHGGRGACVCARAPVQRRKGAEIRLAVKLLQAVCQRLLAQGVGPGVVGKAEIGRKAQAREIFAQKLHAQRVDGADGRAPQKQLLPLEEGAARLCGRALGQRRRNARAKLRSGRAGEGYGQNAVCRDGRGPVAQKRHHALCEHRRFAAARRRAHQQGAAAVFYGALLRLCPFHRPVTSPAFGSNTSLGALAQASSVPSSWRHTGR